MDEKRQKGYVAGFICIFIFILFFVLAFNNAWNSTGQLLWGFTLFFGALGVGSFWKPEVIGGAASQFLESLAKSGREESDSYNKQIQEKTSGSVQVMATRGAKVNINVPSRKKENTTNSLEEEKEFLRKETIVISPTE